MTDPNDPSLFLPPPKTDELLAKEAREAREREEAAALEAKYRREADEEMERLFEEFDRREALEKEVYARQDVKDYIRAKADDIYCANKEYEKNGQKLKDVSVVVELWENGIDPLEFYTQEALKK